MSNQNGLQHYGVPGMKWGVRRARKAAESGNSDKARELYSKHYGKATTKAARLERKVVKTQQKATKQRIKTNKRLARPTFTDIGRAHERFTLKRNSKREHQAYKAQKKAQNWTKKMEKTFSGVKLSEVDKASVDAGRKYTYMLLDDRR